MKSESSFQSLVAFLLVVLGPLYPTLLLPIPTTISMRVAIGVILVMFGLMLQSRQVGSRRFLKFILIFAISICIIPMVVKGYDSFLVSTICAGLLAFIVFRYLRNPSAILYVFVLLSIYFVLYYLRYGSLEDVFYQVGEEETSLSRNFVGILLLHYYLVYYAVCLHTNTKARHWPLWIMPPISAISGGFSSTLASAALLLSWLSLWIRRVKVSHAIIAIGLLALICYNAASLFESTPVSERLETQQVGLDRLILWSDFYGRLDFRSILVGFENDTEFVLNPIASLETGNLHNSYLNLYKQVGIFFIIYLVMIAYNVISLYRLDTVLFLIYSATLLRALTDGYYFSAFSIDFITFYLFLMTPIGSRFMVAVNNVKRPVHGTVKMDHFPEEMAIENGTTLVT